MKNLNVYLAFPGTCEEALNFYKNCLGGEITSIQRYKDSPMDVPNDSKNRIMHSEFKSEGIYFMASDGMPGSSVNPGENVSLNIDFSDESEQSKIFKALSDGGKITMPLQDTFWGAKFGMLTDKYGINWMFNHTKQK